LGQCHNPLSGFRHSGTDILTTDKQENGSSVRYKVVADDEISLLPVGGVLVVGVVEDLLEVCFFLVIKLLDFGLLAMEVPFVGGVFGEGVEGDQEENCDKE
jgi:hypothetical protein